jgi:hypothetical protein
MKKISMILAALLCLPIMASAVPDSVTTGPYNISFDLGLPKDVYNVNVADPKEKESLGGEKSTEYVVNIKNDTGMTRIVMVTITEGTIGTVLLPDEMQASMLSYIRESGLKNIETSERDIDGKKGAIAAGDMYISGLNIKMYQATYYPLKDTLVFINSAYPWDEGTLSLLKTIHIEKINATS